MTSERSDSDIPAPAGPAAPAGGTVARRHIRLTSHSGGFGALPIAWGAASAVERGPIVATTTTRAHRNVIGTHSGSYSVYRALAVASGALNLAMAPHLVAIGEVGLTGEVRRVGAVGRRLAEASRLGFRFALVPPGCGPAEGDSAPKGMRVVEVGDLQTAVQWAARASAE